MLTEGRRRFRWESPPLFDGCKPDFVLPSPKRFGAAVIYLAPASWRRSSPFGLRLLPGGLISFFARPGRRPLPPVLSCTAWGLSCPLAFARGGGLLPRLFTLASSTFTALAFCAEAIGG